MKVSRLSVAALAAVMILSVLSPLGAVAAEGVDEGELSIEVEQNGDVLVTVTDEENATLENATVNVSTVEENANYNGTGEYEVIENGTVELTEPEETVNVTIEATHDDASTETDVTLEAPADDLELSIAVEQDGDAVVTVTDNVTDEPVEATVNVSTVEENANYNETGEYEDIENGTVELTEPEETVNVSITASYENESVTTEATLTSTEDQIVEENDNFGSMVSSYVASLEPSERDGGIGSQVSSFVHEYNPGNAPDGVEPGEQGPPEGIGPDNETEQGPPEGIGSNDDDEQDNGGSGSAAGNGNGGGQGPPSNAGPGGN